MAIDTVAVIGGGVMGAGIAQVLARGGATVTIREVDEESAERAWDRLVSGSFGLEAAREGGHLTSDELDAVLDRVSVTTQLEDTVEGADAVVEAVFEDLELKGEIFRRLDSVTADVPLFSNTSGYPVAALAAAVDDPGRVAVTHFFNPVPVMDLVEIVRAPATADETVETARELAALAEKTSIVVEDDPTAYGFVANRCYGALRREAERIVEAGIATEAQVDTALEAGFNLPVGPFSLRGIGEEWD